jgi:hypothetical protein
MCSEPVLLNTNFNSIHRDSNGDNPRNLKMETILPFISTGKIGSTGGILDSLITIQSVNGAPEDGSR